jgi:hypothetical protein
MPKLTSTPATAPTEINPTCLNLLLICMLLP